MNYPRITIVTPSFNQGQFLEETILSILNQNYPNLEYFVVDGGSTDNSVDIIRKYADRITWWVSEKDRGQTDAINKGLKRSSGEIFNWINSDDLLAPGALLHVADKFRESNALCLSGPIIMFEGERRWEFPAAYSTGESFQAVFGRDMYNQPGTFFHREAIAQMGLPDERLNYVMDKEWFVRYLVNFGTERFAVTHQPLALYRIHGTTKTAGQADKFLTEYAVLTYRIAETVVGKDLLNLISEKYDVADHPFRSQLAADARLKAGATQMLALLLLRRFHRIYSRSDFDFARRMNERIPWENIVPDELLLKDILQMKRNLRWGSWFMFRVARKMGLAGKY